MAQDVNEEHFRKVIAENSRRMSRTRGGKADTSTSMQKHPLLLDGSALACRALENESKAIEAVVAHSPRILDAKVRDIEEILRELGRIVSDGLLPAGLWRAWDIAGKVPVEQLGAAISSFNRKLCERIHELKSDPIPLAAWAEWELNGGSLHPFYDGCGRVSRLFAGLLLLAGGSVPPLYEDSLEYFRQGNSGMSDFVAYVRCRVSASEEWLMQQ